MVTFEDVSDEPQAPSSPVVEEVPSPSQERLLDAEEIEQAAANMKRSSAKLHLESLAKKLRKESAALKRVEESRSKMEGVTVEDVDTSSKSRVAASSAPVAAVADSAKTSTAPPPAPAVPPNLPSNMYTPIDRFSFDAGSYSSPFVTVYVPLPSVGSIPRDNITCDFTPTSFDLIVRDFNGKSYRLFRDNLEKDIDSEKSKYLVKADKIVVKLAKKQTDYGSPEMWTELTSKKKKKEGKKDDPSASIMELMKDMYDSGDDDMKKMIGETMMKQRRGELNGPPQDDFGM